VRPALRAVTVTAILAAAFIAAAAGSGLVFGERKDVADTEHDVATPGVPACVYCHVPRDAAGQLLWPGGVPDADGPLAGQKRLCFSCHDGTVTPERSYVFDPQRPEHMRTPNARGQDCDRCHDAHGTASENFLRLPAGANFCWNCHFRAGPTDHPVGIDAPANGIEPADTEFDPKVGDYSGTRLWNEAGIAPGNLVMCLTCHSPHGGQPGTEMLTVGGAAGQDYYQTLCVACHRR
jgi:predicted CXXCH cytochrome family protein